MATLPDVSLLQQQQVVAPGVSGPRKSGSADPGETSDRRSAGPRSAPEMEKPGRKFRPGLAARSVLRASALEQRDLPLLDVRRRVGRQRDGGTVERAGRRPDGAGRLGRGAQRVVAAIALVAERLEGPLLRRGASVALLHERRTVGNARTVRIQRLAGGHV